MSFWKLFLTFVSSLNEASYLEKTSRSKCLTCHSLDKMRSIIINNFWKVVRHWSVFVTFKISSSTFTFWHLSDLKIREHSRLWRVFLTFCICHYKRPNKRDFKLKFFNGEWSWDWISWDQNYHFSWDRNVCKIDHEIEICI